MSHDWSSLNPVFINNGPIYGLLAALTPPHYCPRCFGKQEISNMGKLCIKCTDIVTSTKTKYQEQYIKTCEQMQNNMLIK